MPSDAFHDDVVDFAVGVEDDAGTLVDYGVSVGVINGSGQGVNGGSLCCSVGIVQQRPPRSTQIRQGCCSCSCVVRECVGGTGKGRNSSKVPIQGLLARQRVRDGGREVRVI